MFSCTFEEIPRCNITTITSVGVFIPFIHLTTVVWRELNITGSRCAVVNPSQNKATVESIV